MVIVVAELRGSECRRNPNIAVPEQRIKGFRHHAKQNVGTTVDLECPSNHSTVGVEPCTPKTLAQHSYLGLPGLIFIAGEHTTQNGRHTESGEIARGCQFALDALRRTVGCEIETRR